MALEFVLFTLKFFFFSFLISLPFLYDLNARFRYHFKFFIFYLLFAFTNLFLAPITAWIWSPICGSNLSSRTIFFLYRIIGYTLNIQWKVIKEETVKFSRPCIIVANQQSSIDLLGVLNTFRTSRKNIVIRQKRPRDYFGFLIQLTSIYNPILTYINKDCKTVVYTTLIREMTRNNANIWIFVDNLEHLENDIFDIAIKEHIPIVQIVFSNYYFINACDGIFDPGCVTVKVLPEIQSEYCSADSVSNMIRNMQTTMENEYKNLSEEVRPLTLDELRQCYNI